jgi:16S rRNA (guanine527-N7)-methyltransferase
MGGWTRDKMATDYAELVRREVSGLGVALKDLEVTVLAGFCSELERWNRKMNLTALQGAEMVHRLVAGPVWIAKRLRLDGVLVDIGSGNGSPGIPVHVVSNLKATHLVEARAKRAAFLRHVVGTLKLDRIQVHKDRFEAAVSELPPADWVTLQAVAPSPQLFDSIDKIARSTTKVVWITGEKEPFFQPIESFEVPGTGTRVFVSGGTDTRCR